MLGEMLGELRHKSTGTRVLPSEGGGPVVEESFQGNGKILGTEVTDTRTVHIVGVHGVGQGVITTKDGETATFTRYGVGWPNETGGHSVRACMFFKTTSQKLARLNRVIVMSESEEDENGNLYEKLWEWK